MIDTLNLSYDFPDEATDKTAFEEIPKCFDKQPTITRYPNGRLELRGTYNGLNVLLSSTGVKVGNCSFAKWLLGTNLKTLYREEIQMGIERLSDAFHLPIDKATVTRLDIGCNLLMSHPVETYWHYLGELQWFSRLPQSNGLYYNGANCQLAFYDKIKELKRDGAKIPGLFEEANILRYEVRLKHRLKTLLNVPEVTAGMLYEEDFYISLWLYWRNSYYNIRKVRELISNGMEAKTITERNACFTVECINRFGGLTKYLEHLKARLKRGEIKKKQEHDLRESAIKAFKEVGNKTPMSQDDGVSELNDKIDQAIRYFR